MSFTFNGVTSDDLGLIVTNSVFRPSWAEERNDLTIPGRSSKMYMETGVYPNEELTIQTAITDVTKIREIYSTICGEGKLILSSNPDEYLYATVEPLIPEGVALEMALLPITFSLAPFAYAIEPTQVQIGKEYTAAENTSSIYSEPVIQIKMKKSSSTILKGDVDMDGKITAADAALVMEEIANIAGGGEPTFTPEQFEAADMDGDGKLTAADAAEILRIYSENTKKDPAAPSQNVIINTNGAKLFVGIPSEVIANGFTVTIDCGLHLIYYTDLSGNMVNILHYSSLDLPLLHEGTNYMKYTGDNVESVTVTINERWL